jgi:hypothetical protein
MKDVIFMAFFIVLIPPGAMIESLGRSLSFLEMGRNTHD